MHGTGDQYSISGRDEGPGSLRKEMAMPLKEQSPVSMSSSECSSRAEDVKGIRDGNSHDSMTV